MNRPRRRRHLCVVSLLAFVAVGCPSSRPDRATPAGAAMSTAPAVERLTAFYPERLGTFQNTGVEKYDRDGHDASVSYNHYRGKETLIAFTAYFYPDRRGNESLDDAVRDATRVIQSANRGARVVDSGPVEVSRDGERREGRRVVFEVTGVFGGQGQRQALVYELHVYRASPGRLVKYHITYPAAEAEQVRGRLNPFVAAFPWPSGL